MTEGAALPVTGWGYEARTVEDLIAHADDMGAALVVDVRLNAISRKRGFSKRGLQASLAGAGIRYLHLPALGNPRDNREAFARPGSSLAAAARDRYIAEVLESEEGRIALRAVQGAAERGPVILLCYEKDESCCHRGPVLSAVTGLASASAVTA